jgi:hypothetical protein
MRLTRSMGVVANPAAKAPLSIPHDVQVVEVPSFVPEVCFSFGEFGLNELFGVTLETQSVSLWFKGYISPLVETFHREWGFPDMNSVTVGTIALSYRLMQESAVINTSLNIPVTLTTVTSRTCPLLLQEGLYFRSMGVVAIRTPPFGRGAVCDALI